MRPVTDLQRKVAPFKVVTDMVPAGDQPTAIAEIEKRVRAGEKDTVLLGATGTGKTATVAWLAERLDRPVLVMLPNKTLAAQFANELREMLPDNAVEYFVSYYDYYQPEAYVPQTDTYIEKDSSINDEVERLRHSATNSLLTRRDTIVVASVSCIYGLGSAQEYLDRMLRLQRRRPDRQGQPCSGTWSVHAVLPERPWPSPAARSGCAATPSRSSRSTRRWPCASRCSATRSSGSPPLHPLTGEVITEDQELLRSPRDPLRGGRGADGARHRSASRPSSCGAAGRARAGGQAPRGPRLRMRTAETTSRMMRQAGRLLRDREPPAAHRLAGRGLHCAEHRCSTTSRGLPSRHRRVASDRCRRRSAMYEGDALRKRVQVDHGFRLPRRATPGPLAWDEYREREPGMTIYLSATLLGPYEMQRPGGDAGVEQGDQGPPAWTTRGRPSSSRPSGQIDDPLEEEQGLWAERSRASWNSPR